MHLHAAVKQFCYTNCFLSMKNSKFSETSLVKFSSKKSNVLQNCEITFTDLEVYTMLPDGGATISNLKGHSCISVGLRGDTSCD